MTSSASFPKLKNEKKYYRLVSSDWWFEELDILRL